MTSHQRYLCIRCGIESTGKVCKDCRQADPAWFALAGYYHPQSNKTGRSVSPERKYA